MPQPMQNPKDSLDPTTAMNATLALLAKAFKVNTIPTNNNQRSSLILRNSQIAQPGMNTSQNIKMKMVDDNVRNQVRHNAVQYDGNEYGIGNIETAPAEGNGNGINGNLIRCYNWRGEAHYASNYTDTLQQASKSRTRSDNAPVYDSDGSTEVPKDENSYDHDIFNMLTHEVQYTDLQTELDLLPKVDKTNALSKPVTSNSAPSTRELKVVQTVNVIAPRIFRTNHSKTSKVDKVVPNKPVKISVRIKLITVSQPNVIHKQQANYDFNGFSSTRVNNTAKTKRLHHRSNSNTDRVPSKSKSSYLSNNIEKIEENHRNSQIPKTQKHMSSKCNNFMLAIQNTKSKIVCVMCKQCLVTANHDVCVLNYVNDMNSLADNQSANVLICENQKKHKANSKKSKELWSKRNLASSRPSKPRTCLRWIPTGRILPCVEN
nr:hypothetical protein [Tanacetum cinerariifolium]GEZ40471.1 hypothetical protein [Tanacetum cinerariifolium]